LAGGLRTVALRATTRPTARVRARLRRVRVAGASPRGCLRGAQREGPGPDFRLLCGDSGSMLLRPASVGAAAYARLLAYTVFFWRTCTVVGNDGLGRMGGGGSRCEGGRERLRVVAGGGQSKGAARSRGVPRLQDRRATVAHGGRCPAAERRGQRCQAVVRWAGRGPRAGWAPRPSWP
jgi:hypothetical protein